MKNIILILFSVAASSVNAQYAKITKDHLDKVRQGTDGVYVTADYLENTIYVESPALSSTMTGTHKLLYMVKVDTTGAYVVSPLKYKITGMVGGVTSASIFPETIKIYSGTTLKEINHGNFTKSYTVKLGDMVEFQNSDPELQTWATDAAQQPQHTKITLYMGTDKKEFSMSDSKTGHILTKMLQAKYKIQTL